VIRESRVKKVLVDGGSGINVTFPRTLQALGVSIADLTQSDTPFKPWGFIGRDVAAAFY
jgi:hypothetical protein